MNGLPACLPACPPSCRGSGAPSCRLSPPPRRAGGRPPPGFTPGNTVGTVPGPAGRIGRRKCRGRECRWADTGECGTTPRCSCRRLHVNPGIRAADEGADGDGHDVRQPVPLAALYPGGFHFSKMLHDRCTLLCHHHSPSHHHISGPSPPCTALSLRRDCQDAIALFADRRRLTAGRHNGNIEHRV